MESTNGSDYAWCRVCAYDDVKVVSIVYMTVVHCISDLLASHKLASQVSSQ